MRAKRFHGQTKLAVVASEDAVADQGTKGGGDRPVQLDGEVRDAQARVEPVGGDDRAGGAGVDAGAAGAAMIRRHLSVRHQGQVGVELAEEEPGAGGPVDEVGVLADPSEPGVARERLLHDRGAVGEGAVAERAGLGLDVVGEALEAAADDLVVIAPERVPGHVAEGRIAEDRLGVGRVAAVVHAHADDPEGSRHQLRGPGAARPVARHVPELAMVAGVEPGEQRRFVGTQVGARDRHLLEAEFHTPSPDRLGERGVVDVGAAGLSGHGGGGVWRRAGRHGGSDSRSLSEARFHGSISRPFQRSERRTAVVSRMFSGLAGTRRSGGNSRQRPGHGRVIGMSRVFMPSEDPIVTIR